MNRKSKWKVVVLYGVIAGAVVLFNAGCCKTTYKVAEPLDAKFDRTLMQIITVSSSQTPVLQWKPVDPTSGDVRYDLVIWKGMLKQGRTDIVTTYWSWPPISEAVYYREGIQGTSHRIESTGTEQLFQPNAWYTWSVRTRAGNKVSPWATHTSVDFTGLGNKNWPFLLKIKP